MYVAPICYTDCSLAHKPHPSLTEICGQEQGERSPLTSFLFLFLFRFALSWTAACISNRSKLPNLRWVEEMDPIRRTLGVDNSSGAEVFGPVTLQTGQEVGANS